MPEPTGDEIALRRLLARAADSVDPSLPVQDVHAMVDEVERGLRQAFPAIKRVIGHAEPGR